MEPQLSSNQPETIVTGHSPGMAACKKAEWINQQVLIPPFKSPELPSSRRTLEEVDQQIARRGFPELNLLWSEYRKKEGTIGVPTISDLHKILSEHTAPLFGCPWRVGIGIGFTASLASIGYVTQVLPSSPINSFMTPWIASNLTVVGIILTCGIQRYITTPLMGTMAAAIGTMLRSPDFRSEIKTSDRFAKFESRAGNLGVTPVWDDKDYARNYQLIDGKVVLYIPQTAEQIIHETLQSFLGRKDTELRKFIPGRFLSYLKGGKESVTRFVSKHSQSLIKSKAGELSPEDGITLLQDLLENEVHTTSAGVPYISETIAKIESGRIEPDNLVEAQVWQRDPWRDLTHQEEFYSSASLRGIKKRGRDSKGRLGTFEYLMNPAISCLDFSLNGARVVRARLGTILLEDKSGGKYPALFVDGVEGSNQIPNKVILEGIREYAEACSIKNIFINSHTHNEVPKRFIRFIRSSGYDPGIAKVELLDTDSRLYLDSFGTPIQPFEYARPLGSVVGFLIPLKEGNDISLQKPTAVDWARDQVRMNSYWMFFGQAFVGTTILSAQISPSTAVVLAAVACIGGVAQVLFQRRSLLLPTKGNS